ncbi:hypothetical protein TD95_003499 [Thielaviopsis punctulata]|uniref:PQ loop repeat protein n=1 Tax=Thielaviopsis punctulata TaxID=72032 RepID=A0A0F4ZKS3_9PEZI|nr:hypothetical protein TD95_003499 [Thielaviopsis punctulata]
MDIPIAANVLGTMGAVCWSVQLIPQIVINYRRHNATGLQPAMMMLWAWAGVPLGVYNIVSGLNVALQVQPQLLTFLSLVTWIQCFYYERKWSVAHCLTVVIPIAALMAGMQASLVVGLRLAGAQWPLTLMAALSAALLALGVLSHYRDIWRHRTVRGISFLFVGIDAAGDVFSLASVLCEAHVDVLAVVVYATELVLWCGVFACGGWYNLRPWLRAWLRERRSVEGGEGNGVAMHEMSSSTSVFSTPGAALELEVRQRRHGSSQGQGGE